MAENEPPHRYGEQWADVYDDVYGSAVPPREQLDFIAELAGDGRALELGIGTGRVALPLIERGVAVEGIDASVSMVDRLRAKPAGGSVPVVVGDMSILDVAGPFRVVYVVFNTFFGLVTQEAQVACFRRVADVLEPGGHFVLECFVPDLTRFSDGQSFRTTGVDDDVARVEAGRHDPLAQQISSVHLRIGSEGTSVRSVRVRYAWPAELDLMAKLAGLSLTGRWGSWGRTPITADCRTHVSVYVKPLNTAH